MKLSLLYFLLFLFPFGLLAQQPYHFTFDDADGLPSNIAYHVLEDSNGFIWVATNEGLSRFDGKYFKEYKNTAQTSLPGSNVQEDSKGRIWYQNFDGYCYYVENDQLMPLDQNKPIGFLPMGITKDYIFLVQTKGIDVYEIASLKRIKTIAFSEEMKEIYHTAAFNSNFYVLTNVGLYEINSFISGFSTKLKFAAGKEKYNQIHICNEKLVLSSRFNEKGKFAILQADNSLDEVTMPDFSFIHAIYGIDDFYWVLTPKGAWLFKEGKFQRQLLPNFSLSSVFKDRNQNIWVSTTQKGLLLIPSLSSTFWPIKMAEPNLIERLSDGYLLFTQNGSIIRCNRTFTEQKLVFKNTSHASFYYTYKDTSNNKIFASSSGVNTFQIKPFQELNYNQLAVKEMVKLDDSYYAMATSGNAILYKIKGKNLRETYSHWNQLVNKINSSKSDEYFSFFTDVRAKTISYDSASKAIYIGTNLGLFRQTIDGRTEIKHQQKSLFISRMVTYNGVLFALNTHGELLKIENEKVISVLNKQSNIQLNVIKSIKAFAHNLCIMGDSRFLVIDMRQPELNSFVLPIPIKSTEINDVLLEGNNLLLVLRNGIISTPFSINNKIVKTPKFAIIGFELSGKTMLRVPSALEPTQNQMSIHYALLNYASAEKTKLWYKINQEDWVLCDPNLRSLQFAYLAPGQYQIQFKLNDKLLTNQSISFAINKPIWQQFWFILLSGLLLVTAGISYYKWQINLLVKKNRLTTEKMELENALNMSRLRSIKSQMNPHFFYNALNTIQSYIFTNEKKLASNYLGKFSNLTRMILEMSEMDLVSLNQEIKALNLYIELEQMRFEDELVCSLFISEELDLDMIKIPPMLVQPYIENALKHGLMHKSGQKELTVKFEGYGQGFIKVTIDDNGIGRERSAELNKNRLNKHQSFASEANQKRLAILNTGKANHFGIEILDKKNREGQSLGTCITLIIPIN